MRQNKIKVYVDGQAGTTGLKINERLQAREDIILLSIEEEKRKDTTERKRLLNQADVVFLCLPDQAAKESVGWVENTNTCIIDASTAHRTAPGWAYGFPELSPDHRQAVASSRRVAVAGCHATGFLSAVYPLVREGILSPDYPVSCHSITGYSGGGKSLIERYEASGSKQEIQSPQFYALGLSHKHLPEMQKVSGLSRPPLFDPIVGPFRQGMAVTVPLHTRLLDKKMSAMETHHFLTSYYEGQRFIQVMPFGGENHLDEGFFGAMACNDTNKLELFVFGHEEQILLIARLDNLGKGASGAAVQNMNIMLGLDESTGL